MVKFHSDLNRSAIFVVPASLGLVLDPAKKETKKPPKTPQQKPVPLILSLYNSLKYVYSAFLPMCFEKAETVYKMSNMYIYKD